LGDALGDAAGDALMCHYFSLPITIDSIETLLNLPRQKAQPS
jgi:hypothetical protein